MSPDGDLTETRVKKVEKRVLKSKGTKEAWFQQGDPLYIAAARRGAIRPFVMLNDAHPNDLKHPWEDPDEEGPSFKAFFRERNRRLGGKLARRSLADWVLLGNMVFLGVLILLFLLVVLAYVDLGRLAENAPL